MAKSKTDRQRAKQKKIARRKQRIKRDSQRRIRPLEPSNKVARKLADCYELVDDQYFSEAENILDRLVVRHGNVPAVVETQLMLYQESGNSKKACMAAKRLLELTPRDPDALMMYAQESLHCGRATIAFLCYRQYLNQFPDHQNANKARSIIDVCEKEARNRVEKSREAGFHDFEFEEAIQLYALHEESLARFQSLDFENTVLACEKVLAIAPNFLSARNNLASCHFHSGDLRKAVAMAQETCDLDTKNRYAQANLIKLSFLAGDPDQANQIADQLVADFPQEQDAIAAACEALFFLGRDEDIVAVAAPAIERKEFDPEILATIHHHLAVAHFRLGDERAARRHWKKCLAMAPNHSEAQANLRDLDEGIGHAAWAEPLAKWLPQALISKAISKHELDSNSNFHLIDEIPGLLTLIPALLDRGDPDGREFAVNMAEFKITPELVGAFREFGTSNRGPDSLRHRALFLLYQNEQCAAGPHRFYSRGSWTEVQLFSPEITEEPIDDVPKWQKRLMEQANVAMHADELDEAESAYQSILDRDPDCRSAKFNLASAWLRRSGPQHQARAKEVIEQLHLDHPDYVHATIAMAQFASMRGDSKEAARLLGEIMKLRKLHFSEASSLFVTQAQIALNENNIQAAENACHMLAELNGEDAPVTMQIRQLIENVSSRSGLFQKLIADFPGNP